MQLLKITNIPIQYQIEIERAHLEYSQPPSPKVDITTEPSKLRMKSKPVQIRLDTTDMRASIGLKDTSRVIKEEADKGMKALQDATAQYAEIGNQMAQIYNKQQSDITQIMARRLFAQPQTVTAFLPSVGPSISWSPNSLDTSYQAGKTELDWQVYQNTMDFVPGKFRMNILQYPKVQIEYVGEPNYVPPSANPNYEEEAI